MKVKEMKPRGSQRKSAGVNASVVVVGSPAGGAYNVDEFADGLELVEKQMNREVIHYLIK